MRGDAAVPTLFNGNFDAVFNPQVLNRTIFSDAIPGWSSHNCETSASVSTSALVDVNQLSASDAPALHAELDRIGVDRTQANYALKLESGKSITHNRFVVPEWGTLRFNLHVPELTTNGKVKVSIKGNTPNDEYQLLETVDDGTIDLRVADGRLNPGATPEIAYPLGYADTDTYRIGYGERGFETFHVDIPEELRGEVATLKFELTDGTVYLDDVFFQSTHLKFGAPTFDGQEARPDAVNNANNYLLEKPQYSLSYNSGRKNSNRVSWQLDRSWDGDVPTPDAPWGNNPPSEYPGDRNDYPWRPDNALPSTLPRTISPEYTNSGFDRGHMTPRGSRNRTDKDQLSTFLTTNMLPPDPTNNRQGTAWARLENFCEDLVEETPSRELYIIAGGFGSLNPELEFNNPLRLAGINVPEETWKVIAILELGQNLSDITSKQVIAVSIPNSGLVNIPDAPDVNFWPTHITTVREIELNTGLDLLSNLPEEIEEIIETTPYSGRTSI